MATTDFQSLYNAADAAGRAAAESVVPVPIIVKGYEHQPIMDGLCGFASIRFPGNTAWGRWAKKQGIASKAYPKGLMIWVRGYGQSVTRKESYAIAFANVLRDNGVKAYAESRLD